MQFIEYPATRSCHIPADCYNLARLARKRIAGRLELNLPGMLDNTVLLGEHHWKCWNRKLDALLMSWEGFENGNRKGLVDPVECKLTVHHSYSRTIMWHLYDSLKLALKRELDYLAPATEASSTVLAWRLARQGPHCPVT